MSAVKKRTQGKDLVLTAAIFLLVLVILYSGLQILESTVLRSGQDEPGVTPSKTITRDGVDYFPRQDITVLLVMGIDEYGAVQPSESYDNKGAVDVVMLMILDKTREVCDILYLNRDTMLEMPVLGLGGKPAGTYFGQLALSHTFGTGLEDSCENVRQAVSDFLYGLDIDYYVSMRMDAIPILNDGVGGVTVTVAEDFSAVDPTIGMGEVTLMGQQAINFIRTRKGVGDQLNLSRIERQKEYVGGFMEAVRSGREDDPVFMVSLWEEVSPYLVTDCSTTVLTGLLDRCGDYALGEVISPEGSNVMGKEYMEFYVDEEKLDELILRLFYAPKG